MALIEQYNAAVASSEISNDPAQRNVIEHLQRVINDLAMTKRSWWSCWPRKTMQGLYLHGPVGVGKTYLVDLFYQAVPEPCKARFHFHHFMQQIDAQLRRLQGKKDPLKHIAATIAKTTRLLCFDEFLVYDVADAMILAELLGALFAHNVVIVVTSNTSPDQLYLNGVHRGRFLPAIHLIEQHCDVVALIEQHDYRLGRTPLQQAYIYPLNERTQAILAKQFAAMTDHSNKNGEISVQNRLIPYVECGQRVIWFKFGDICNLPRCQLDYLELAERFDTVFVSDIPALSSNHTVSVILLINFIDVMYDRGIRLIISAAVSIEQLYTKGEMYSPFQRTLSRLEEMQSEDYLRRHQRRDIQLLI